MDDDDFRRGRPSCHKAFGEGLAILAGDALLTEAFRVMAEAALGAEQPGRALRATAVLARAAGAEGMVGGQEMDISADPGRAVPSEIEAIALRKTAALIAASAEMGGILGGGADAQVDALSRYGRSLGLLFQVTDDIIDQTGSFEEMGKSVAKDKARGKLTYPIALGMDPAVRRAEALAAESSAALGVFGEEARDLRRLVAMVAGRRS
jgi:geranylgeranyl diphosphate synthase type II